MEKKLFEVKGKILEGRNEKAFAKKVNGFNERTALEKTLALFGSKQKVKRRNIKVEEVREVK